jgi:hypothetical protein
MTMLPSPVALWDELPNAGVAGGLSRLAPYLTTDGFWLYLAPTEVPSGATPGARVESGADYDVMLTTTTIGLRATQAPGGTVFFY